MSYKVKLAGLALTCVSPFSIATEPTEQPPLSIVYSRQPISTQEACNPQGQNCVHDGANWQHKTDIARVHRLSEADLVRDYLNGTRETIHDCTASENICAAIEARVSPDAKSVIYSLCKGTSFIPVGATFNPGVILQDVRDFDCAEAELWLYDVQSKERRRLSSGFQDRQPDWISNSEIVFTSNREGTHAPLGRAGNYYPGPALQIHRARITAEPDALADIKNLTPHEPFALNPVIDSTTGNVMYVGWWGHMPRQPGTPRNRWVVSSVGQHGTFAPSATAELGAHGSPYITLYPQIEDWVDPERRGDGLTEIRGLRCIAEIFPGEFAVSNYYRGNHLGCMGTVLGWTPVPGEGEWTDAGIDATDSNDTRPGSGRFLPRSFVLHTPYGTDQDNMGRFDKQGRPAGKAGYPAPWVGDGDSWLFTHCRGICYEGTIGEWTYPEALSGEPSARQEIRLALVREVTNPFDSSQSIRIAGDSSEHAWDARVVATYQDLMGKPAPPQQSPPTSDTCSLTVMNIRRGELLPIPGREDLKNRTSLQGNALPCAPECNYALRIELIEQWTEPPTREGWASRQLHSIVPADADGKVGPVSVPCDHPMLISAQTAEGMVSAQDNQPMLLPSGQKLVCTGCHADHDTSAAEKLPAGC